MCVDTARQWRRRLFIYRLDGLVDRPRSGRPRRFTSVQVAAITALACTLPAETGVPLSRWSSTELATEAVTRGVVPAISPSTVRRCLDRAAIKPWQHRSWIFPRDPDFEDKAARVLDLYARTWDGIELGPDDYVISADGSPVRHEALMMPCGMRGSPPVIAVTGRSWRQIDPRVRGEVGSSLDNVGAGRDYQTARAR